ncbi:MAG: hypothetical protein ACYDCL_08150 [Myxococcales bacterium]
MKRATSWWLAAFLPVLAASACSQGPAPQSSNDVQINPRTVLLDNVAGGPEVQVAPDQLVFPAQASSWVAKLQPGDPLVCGPSCGSGTGLLRKVVSVSPAGSGWAVQTVHAQLIDVVWQGDFAVTITPDQLEGNELSLGTFGVDHDINKSSAIGLEATPEVNFQLKKLTFQFTPTFDLHGSIVNSCHWYDPCPRITKFHVSAGGAANAAIEASVTANLSVGSYFDWHPWGDEGKTLGRTAPGMGKQIFFLKTPNAWFTVGPIPFAVRIAYYAGLEAGVDLSGQVNVDVGATLNTGVTIGADYNYGTWTPIHQANFTPGLIGPKVQAEADLTVWAGLDNFFTMELDDALDGPFIDIGFPTIALKGTAACDPEPAGLRAALQLQGSVGVGAEVALDVFGFKDSLGSRSFELFGPDGSMFPPALCWQIWPGLIGGSGASCDQPGKLVYTFPESVKKLLGCPEGGSSGGSTGGTSGGSSTTGGTNGGGTTGGTTGGSGSSSGGVVCPATCNSNSDCTGCGNGYFCATISQACGGSLGSNFCSNNPADMTGLPCGSGCNGLTCTTCPAGSGCAQCCQ